MIDTIRIIRKTNPAWYWLLGYAVAITALLACLMLTGCAAVDYGLSPLRMGGGV